MRTVQEHSASEKEGKAGDDGDGEEMVMPPQAHIHIPPPSRQELQAQGSTQMQPQESQQQIVSGTSQEMEQESTQTQNPETKVKGRKRNVIYQVRSSQAPKSRFKDSISTSSLIYTVRLPSWNCSCAAFAFESFPGLTLSREHQPWLDLEGSDEDDHAADRHDETDEDGWQFGGLSFEGLKGGEGKAPVCKHLLACLLVERWAVLGGHVKEREVVREEMAGLGGDG